MTRRRTSILIAGALAVMMTMPMGTVVFAQSNAAPASSSQVPQPDEGGVNWQGVGYGAGSLLTNVVYIPAKLVYAILGGLVGGGAWCLTGGNTQTANTIWRSSLGGDYVVTPDMLAGKEPIHFSGPTDTAPIAADSTTVQPLNPMPGSTPTPMMSSMPSYSAPPAAPASGGGMPMDRGAGSVGHPGGPSTLPDTSIE